MESDKLRGLKSFSILDINNELSGEISFSLRII